jgi:hypothetical protein
MNEELISRTLPDALDTWTDQTRWYSEFVQELKDELARVDGERSYYYRTTTSTVERHKQDVRFISEALIAEAETRGWCSDYDKFIEKLNQRLVQKLEEREREYVVSATYLLKVSTTIKATDIDDANDKAAELDLGDFDVSIRGDFDDCEYQDHDIEEA